MIARAYKYRLYPTPAQAARLAAWQDACWEVQRLCIRQRRIAWRRRGILGRGPLPSWASQGREVTELRAADAQLADVPADTMSAIPKRVDEAYQKQRKAGRRVTVRWADCAADVGLVFRGAHRGTAINPIGDRFAAVALAGANKLGVLRVRYHRPIPAGAEIKQAHITRAADGWYIAFSCLIPDLPAAALPDVLCIGVDLNVKHEGDVQAVAAVDDGRVYRSTNGLKQNARRLATLQKLVSKGRHTRGTAKAADPKSKRTARRRARIARLHQRIARQRDHTLQYVARRLTDTAQTIGFEKLNLQGMRRKGKGRHKRGLNRAMATAAPGRLIALTEEKAGKARVVKVDPRNTTQACSACGVIGQRKGLAVRRWRCEACGAIHDRDINAARNIRARVMDTGLFRPGVPGECVAILDSEQRPMNLEAAWPQPASNAGSLPARKSSRVSRKKQVAEQMTIFDLL